MQFASCLRSLRRGWAGALRMPQFSSSIVYSGVALPLLPGRRGEIYIIPQRDQNYSIQITSQLHEAEKPGIYHLRISVDGRTAQEIIISHANGEQSVTKECTGMVSSGGEWVAPFRWKQIVQTHATTQYPPHPYRLISAAASVVGTIALEIKQVVNFNPAVFPRADDGTSITGLTGANVDKRNGIISTGKIVLSTHLDTPIRISSPENIDPAQVCANSTIWDTQYYYYAPQWLYANDVPLSADFISHYRIDTTEQPVPTTAKPKRKRTRTIKVEGPVTPAAAPAAAASPSDFKPGTDIPTPVEAKKSWEEAGHQLLELEGKEIELVLEQKKLPSDAPRSEGYRLERQLALVERDIQLTQLRKAFFSKAREWLVDLEIHREQRRAENS